ncbi:EamA family transporter [Neisseriaceae bacterium TC5R-5]|nr:EamA family transporter [Neisseriaceae bacterium TC5R-5]
MMPWMDVLQALAIVLVWGVNFVVIKWGVADVPPLLLGALRFTLVALPAVLFIRRPVLPWRYLLLYGMTVGVGQFALLFSAIKFGMPAGLASLVLQSQIFFTFIFARVWLAEPWQRSQMLGLCLASCGLGLIGLSQGSSMTALGFALTVAAASSWAVSNVVVRHIGKIGYQIPPLGLVVWSSLPLPIPFLLLSWALEGRQQIVMALTHFTGQALFAVCYLAFAASLFGYGLWSRLLSRHPAGKVATFSLLVPVVGLSAASLLLGERLSSQQAMGSLLLLAGLMVCVFGARWFVHIKQRVVSSRA